MKASFAFLLLCTVRRHWPDFVKVATEANEKLVKLYGAGGYRGAESFGTGVIVSPQGHIHAARRSSMAANCATLPDSRKYAFKIKMIEPAAMRPFSSSSRRIAAGASILRRPRVGRVDEGGTGHAGGVSNMYKVAGATR
jgi:hypothetical protein